MQILMLVVDRGDNFSLDSAACVEQWSSVPSEDDVFIEAEELFVWVVIFHNSRVVRRWPILEAAQRSFAESKEWENTFNCGSVFFGPSAVDIFAWPANCQDDSVLELTTMGRKSLVFISGGEWTSISVDCFLQVRSKSCLWLTPIVIVFSYNPRSMNWGNASLMKGMSLLVCDKPVSQTFRSDPHYALREIIDSKAESQGNPLGSGR